MHDGNVSFPRLLRVRATWTFVSSPHFCAYLILNAYSLCASAFDRTGPTVASYRSSQRYRLTTPHYDVASRRPTIVVALRTSSELSIAAYFTLSRYPGICLFCLLGGHRRVYTLIFDLSIRFSLLFFSRRSVRICCFLQTPTAQLRSLYLLTGRRTMVLP